MKKFSSIAFGILAIIVLAASCNKVNTDTPQGNTNTTEVPESPVSGELVTISVSIPEVLTKVSLEQDSNPDGAINLKWQTGDVILIADSSNSDNKQTFTLQSGEGTTDAVFAGTAVAASSYDITINPVGSANLNADSVTYTQDQTVDGNTEHLRFGGKLTGVNTYQDVEFSSTWASSHGGGSFAQSSVFRLRAQMPAGVTEKVSRVVITAKAIADDTAVNIFGSGNTLTVNLNGEPLVDAESDGVLNIYATLPATETTAIPNGTYILVQFFTTDNTHSVYTRYYEIPNGNSFNPGQVNALKLKCGSTATHAGNPSCDGTTAEKAYLIGDKYQLDSVNGLLGAKAVGTTVYFKLINDIDLTGIANWTPINASTRPVFFEGNDKKISNLKITSCDSYPGLFSILYGTVQHLEIKDASITASTNRATGIVTGYICSNNSSLNYCNINNVTITSPTISGGSQYCGAVGGLIGTHATRQFSISISDVTVTGASISTSNDCGGLLGWTQSVNTTGVSANRMLNISTINIIDSEISTTGTGKNVGGLIGKVDDPHATISGVNIKGTKVSGSNKALTVGGIVGWVSDAADFDGCTFEKNSDTNETATVTGTANIAEAEATIRYTGGLVGSLTGAASFDDCHVKNATVTLTGTSASDAARYVGGAFGGISASATIGESAGCTVEGITITNGKHYTGGFVGYLTNGAISNCSVTPASSFTLSAISSIGGFAGYIGSGTLSHDTTSLPVSGSNNVGGFVGSCAGGTFENNCSASGNVTATAENVGGFCGRISGASSFSSCSYTDGTVQGPKNTDSGSTQKYIGGFAGLVDNVNAQFDGCNVTNATVKLESGSSVYDKRYLGGAFGYLGASVVVGNTTGCIVSGITISNAVNYTGGFVGYLDGGTIKMSSVSGNKITAKSSIGGFAGYIASGTLSGNTTSIEVDGVTNVGGFVGQCAGGTFEDNNEIWCQASGNVTGNGDSIGGFVGYASGGSFKKCTASGNVETSGTKVGGFVGNTTGTVPYDTCQYGGVSNSKTYVKSTANSDVLSLGGFCGELASFSSEIKNCEVKYCKVESTVHQRYVGGFFGRGGNAGGGNTGNITKCVVNGVDVIGHQYTGGFAGALYSDTSCTKVINSSVSVYGSSTGSFVGYLRYCTVENSYTTTTIKQEAKVNNVGAFIGYVREGSSTYPTAVYRCYTSGTINENNKGGSYHGGFFGQVEANCTFDYCICWNDLGFWGTNNGTDGGHNFTASQNGGASGKLYDNSANPKNGATNIINSHWNTTTIWDVTNTDTINDGKPRLR